MPNTHAPLTDKCTTSLVSEICRVSHPALVRARGIKNDPTSKEKFGASLIFEPADTMNIWEAIKAVANAKFPPLKLADGSMANGEQMLMLGMLHSPLRAGTERPTDPAYAGKYFINTGSEGPPQLVGPDGSTILQPTAFYAGCYARAFLGIYTFDKGVNKGVGIGLNALQFVRDGERIDGRGDARAAFASAGSLPASAPQPGSGYNGQPFGGQAPGGYAAPAPSFSPPTGGPVAAGTPVHQAAYPAQGTPPGYPPAGGPARGPAVPPGQ